MNAFVKIGHRGACGYEPENTLRSFAKALELGVDMVELDVRLCRSGELVVFHDGALERTTNGSGIVEEKTLPELRGLDAGRGERIPLLTEVLDLLDRRTGVNIELKGAGTAQPVGALIGEYVARHGWPPESFLVSSFHYDELIAFSGMYPSVLIGILTTTSSHELFSISPLFRRPFSVHPFAGVVNSAYVDEAHRRGLKVLPWTVNEPSAVAFQRSLGVDGAFSDYPDRL